MSLRISKCLVPFGVETLISSPSVLPTMARPIGELVEMGLGLLQADEVRVLPAQPLEQALARG